MSYATLSELKTFVGIPVLDVQDDTARRHRIRLSQEVEIQAAVREALVESVYAAAFGGPDVGARDHGAASNWP